MNVKVGLMVSKRLLRLGWLVVVLMVLQLGVVLSTPQALQSRTAAVPPLADADAALQRQRLH